MDMIAPKPIWFYYTWRFRADSPAKLMYGRGPHHGVSNSVEVCHPVTGLAHIVMESDYFWITSITEDQARMSPDALKHMFIKQVR